MIPNKMVDGKYICAICCVPDPKLMSSFGALVCSIGCDMKMRKVISNAKGK